ncbi:MAG: TIGR02147 family protein [Bdellovibrionaceae bacterium]|nr:TIGR02147 family protein [Bdellovibrionales bacterium]MCB9253283.1 TIGR02147 family protein [Pseudobdellovibrionaceae bacterium]
MRAERNTVEESEQTSPSARTSWDFRFYLQDELLRRCRKNPSYSMRSFARVLKLDSSALSKILNGKRGISKRMLKRLGESLGLSPQDMVQFRPTHGNRAVENTRQRSFELLSLDTFQFISNWYYYGILSLIDVKGFVPNPKWIATALGVTVSEVKIAVERLERLGLLEILEDGSWLTKRKDLTTVGHEYTAPAFRALQKQVLEKALEALEEVPLEQRDQSSMTMAIDASRLPQAKERIKKFRRDLCNFLQSTGKLDQVYQMSVSLYPVSNLPKEG